MRNPLVPFYQYDLYGELAFMTELEKFVEIRRLIDELEPINRNTLMFCIKFFRELISYESNNKMTSYNVAVTVGPNIFRPKSDRSQDIISVGVYYDAMIKMIENYDALFGEEFKLDGLNIGTLGT